LIIVQGFSVDQRSLKTSFRATIWVFFAFVWVVPNHQFLKYTNWRLLKLVGNLVFNHLWSMDDRLAIIKGFNKRMCTLAKKIAGAMIFGMITIAWGLLAL
jgi:hypothetical protein